MAIRAEYSLEKKQVTDVRAVEESMGTYVSMTAAHAISVKRQSVIDILAVTVMGF